jgi:hypothetical protein
MTGPYHYKRAEEILAEVEAADAVPDGTGTVLAIRAQAHALLALAAATAIDPAACRGTSGTTSQGIPARAPSDRAIRPAAARPCQVRHPAAERRARTGRA